jgi:signal transduction histidine kinase
MRLTIGRKLALGFGALITLLAVTAIIVVRLANTVQSDVQAIDDVGEELAEAGFEIEINVVETGVSVLQYIRSGDAQYRQRLTDAQSDFTVWLEQYRTLAQSQSITDLSDQIVTLYDQYVLVGQSLMDARDREATLLTNIGADFDRIDAIIDDEIQLNLTLDRTEVVVAFSELETDIAEVGTWLGNYLAIPSEDSRQRIFDNAEDVRADITAARLLALTEVEARFLDEISTLFEESVLRIQSVLDTSDQIRTDTATFLDLRTRMDTLLDEEVQPSINQFGNSLEQQAIVSAQQITLISIGVIIVGSVVALAVVSLIARSILGSVRELRMGAEAIGGGQLNHRITVTSQDELGDLAEAFNEMAEREGQNIKRLDTARREAEEATRMKDLFLATMSHELRTPLNAMIGFLHLMIYSGQMDEDNIHMAERSLANTQRLLTLINNILDLSRIATGGLEIVPSEMSPRQVAAGLYNDLKHLAQEKKLRLELDVDPLLPETIYHDEARISQVVTNLVSNAIKFTEKGEIHLALKRGDERLVIQVTDTGVGIPQSKQHLIFDDFFQVDSTSTRKQQGAGLGLAIVKRLVLLMNGSINLVSEVEKGSIFTVELPLELSRYEPGDRRKQAEHVFARSMNGSSTQPNPVVQN